MFNTFLILDNKVNKEKLLFDIDVQRLKCLLRKTDSPGNS